MTGINALSAASQPLEALSARAPAPPSGHEPDGELRQAFDRFVGEVFYGQMLKSLRSTQQEAAYFHGGRGEEMFREQLDGLLVEKMSQSQRPSLSDSMFELFQLHRS